MEPDHPVANHNLGILLSDNGDALGGLPFFVKAINANPAQGQYWLSYIDALIQAGQIEDARKVLVLARQNGLQGEMVETLASRLENDNQTWVGPSNREIEVLVALFGERRYEEAACFALKLTENYPYHEFGWKGLGVAYKELGRNEEALEPMQKAVALSPRDVEVHYNLGVVLQGLDRFADAEECYRKALEIKPEYVDAHINLGVLHYKYGQFHEAEQNLGHAMKIAPRNVKAIFNLGNVLIDLKKPQEAELVFKGALMIPGSQAEAYFGLGKALKEQKCLDEAEAAYRQSLAFNSESASVYYNLGNLYKDMGRMIDAIASYRHAINIEPGLVLAHYNLGNILKELDRLDDAEVSYRRAIALNPEHAEAYCSLGMVLSSKGRFKEAEVNCRRALDIKPVYADAHCVLGIIFLKTKKLDEAAASLRWALQIEPGFVEVYNNLALVLKEMGNINEAIITCQKAVEIKPDFAEAHNNLGTFYLSIGQVNQSIQCLRKALEHKPDYALAHSNLIFTQDLSADMTMLELQDERRKWDAIHGSPFYGRWFHENKPDPDRKLRIGYISADFRTHSAPFVFGGMLMHYDATQFDVFAYSNYSEKDELTEKFQKSVTLWRDIFGMSDDEVARIIREDKIDILVDLSGHSAGNRLLVFAMKPAPIQVTAWGYAAGTGMRAMDALFSDSVFVPPSERKYYAEEVRYLPCAISFSPFGQLPAVNPLPALSSKGITFGSFNRLSKNSEASYHVWSEILKASPGSRMVIKNHELNDEDTRSRVMLNFINAGIDPARIILLGGTSRFEHLSAFNQIDIALDPFPHGGGVTALEGLMMGVPMVSLRWPSLTGRISASIMTALNLTDWIAETEEEYVELALLKAKDLESLSALRQHLRDILESSVVGDQVAYARVAEHEYRTLWREWCEKRESEEEHK